MKVITYQVFGIPEDVFSHGNTEACGYHCKLLLKNGQLEIPDNYTARQVFTQLLGSLANPEDYIVRVSNKDEKPFHIWPDYIFEDKDFISIKLQVITFD